MEPVIERRFENVYARHYHDVFETSLQLDRLVFFTRRSLSSYIIDIYERCIILSFSANTELPRILQPGHVLAKVAIEIVNLTNST